MKSYLDKEKIVKSEYIDMMLEKEAKMSPITNVDAKTLKMFEQVTYGNMVVNKFLRYIFVKPEYEREELVDMAAYWVLFERVASQEEIKVLVNILKNIEKEYSEWLK